MFVCGCRNSSTCLHFTRVEERTDLTLPLVASVAYYNKFAYWTRAQKGIIIYYLTLQAKQTNRLF